jgi:hypothetical protein
MSPHDPKIIYAASNSLVVGRGQNGESSGTDLTQTNANRDDIVMGVKGSDIRISKNDGIEAWPTIISFAESANAPACSTRNRRWQPAVSDTGRTRTNVANNIPGLPKGIWVSEVVPSKFDEGTVYASRRHWQNDFGSYIYVSHDFGQTAAGVSQPEGRGHQDATEDLKNPNVRRRR